MERLTKRNEHGKAYYPYCFKENTCDGLGTSEQCDMCDFDQNVCEKLAEYEDLEEQGRLIKLPYPLGTEKLYFVWDYEIYELNAKEITFYKADKFAIRPYETVISVDSYDFYYDDFGKTVFLTKEEAEKALAEMGE